MDLAVVIPVFNEEKSIQSLLEDMYKLFLEENIAHQFIILNDGSTDESGRIVESLKSTIPTISLIHHKNSGHGPSLMKGYEIAADYPWIFQFDSDYQYSLSAFLLLWKNRAQYDLLIAERQDRSARISRRLITRVLRYFVRKLYGKAITDINTPYRLIRGSRLKPFLKKIKKESFAPNMLLSASFVRSGYPIFITKTSLRNGALIRQSKMSPYFFKGCIKSIVDLFLFRCKL